MNPSQKPLLPVGIKPYYLDERAGIAILLGDCREILPTLDGSVMVTDPPYGICYESGRDGGVPRSIEGDQSTELRDWAMQLWGNKPAAVFATWRCIPPSRPRGALVWAKNAGGMGDLSFPWKPDFEMVWVFGAGWSGHRGSGVLRGETIVSWNTGSAARRHPHEKPVDILAQIIAKAPDGIVIDPFMGSGTTLRAAKDLHRKAIGIEIDERYCEIAANRLRQNVLPLG